MHRVAQRSHALELRRSWIALRGEQRDFLQRGRAAFIAAAFLCVACRKAYPLAPTFCDDWCRGTREASLCDRDPEDCVSDCEESRGLLRPMCKELQQPLLSCYEAAPTESFSCAGDGFGAEVRVRPEVCRSERDALLECQVPGLGLCLDACRQIQGEQLASVPRPTPGVLDFAAWSRDAGVDARCPALNEPCESICVSVLAFGAGSGASSTQCLLEALQACSSGGGESDAADAGGRAEPQDAGSPTSDAGSVSLPGDAAVPRLLTIAQVLERCAGHD